MNIRDCGLGTQTIYSHSESTYTEMPQPICDQYLEALASLTDGKSAYVSNGKFELSSHETSTTIYNPMNAPVHIRLEWVVPRLDLDQRLTGWKTDANTAYQDFKSTHIGASYMDLPLIGQRWRFCRKPQSFWLGPGASKTIYMRHIKRPLVVNLREGRFQTTINGAPDTNLSSVYKGISKYLMLTLYGPVSQNNMNTEAAIAQSSFSNARVVIGSRYRTIFRPLFFTGATDVAQQVNTYVQGFRTTYSNSGVPLITTRAFNAKLDDDDTRPSGFGTNAKIASGDQQVQTHNS